MKSYIFKPVWTSLEWKWAGRLTWNGGGMELMEPPSAMGTPPQLEKSIFENRWALSQIQYQYVPYANHGAGIFTYICLGDLSWANVGIHIPAPWSIWVLVKLGTVHSPMEFKVIFVEGKSSHRSPPWGPSSGIHPWLHWISSGGFITDFFG